MPKPDDDPLLLDRQICFPLYAASNLLTRLYRPVLSPLGLTYPQYLVMLVLWEDGTVSVGDLGTRLHLDSGTLTPLLKRMEQSGFVLRHRDARDERRVLISLTDKGTALRKDALQVPRTLAAKLGLDEQAFDTLRTSVHALITTLADPNTKS